MVREHRRYRVRYRSLPWRACRGTASPKILVFLAKASVIKEIPADVVGVTCGAHAPPARQSCHCTFCCLLQLQRVAHDILLLAGDSGDIAVVIFQAFGSFLPHRIKLPGISRFRARLLVSASENPRRLIIFNLLINRGPRSRRSP